MFKITKQFAFEAAHHLHGLPEGHQCARQHGHSYRVEVELCREFLDHTGFVTDYGELEPFAVYLKEHFDHKDLNELPEFQFVGDTNLIQTSAEQIAFTLYKWCKKQWPNTTAVRVSETQKTWAEYRP